MYNNLVGLRNSVKNSYSQIDVQLKRRNDLIPNLLETVKGYAAHEKGVLEEVTKNSFVLLDESFSSTGAYEASYIAAEVLAGFSRIGCRCLFSTHLHELAAQIDTINERTAKDGGAKIDTLVAGIEDGNRSFKIVRMKPDGKSYARDIADKYGLSYENIVNNMKKS